MKFRKTGLAIAFFLLVSLMLAACGDSTTAAPVGTSAAASAAATTAATSPAATTAKVAGTTTAATGTTTAAIGTTTAATGTTTAATGTTTATTTTAPAGSPATTAASSGTAPKGKVIVGSKDFTESLVTAELYAQILEANGVQVERKFDLGSADIAHTAITKGDISLYPEYTSTALTVIAKQTSPGNDAKAIYDAAAKYYKDSYKLSILTPSPFNDTNGLAVTKATADKYNLKTLSDLSKVANQLKLATNPEFVGKRTDIDGLNSLKKTYGGFDFKPENIKQIDIKLRYQNLKDGSADVAVAFTTEIPFEKEGLVLLQDDKSNFQPTQLAPVVRDDVLAAYPNIQTVLNNLSAKLNDQNIRDLNYKVDGPDKKEVPDAVKEFIKEQGLGK